MTSKQKKGLRSTIDDVLGDLLGEGSHDLPMKNQSPSVGVGSASGALPTRGGKRSLLDEDFFSKLAEEAEKDDEGSDVSEANPKAIVESMKDIDDMDADLFSSKRKPRLGRTKPSSAPAQSTSSASGALKGGAAEPGEEARTTTSHPPAPEERKPSSAPPAAVRGYRKFSFVDDAPDAQGGVRDDLNPEHPKSILSGKAETTPSPTATMKEQRASSGPVLKQRDELTFDDDDDDLMNALGFSDIPKHRGSGAALKKESEAPVRVRTRLDEILGVGTSSHLLQRPATGEKKHTTQPERTPESPTKRSTEREPERSVERQQQPSSASRDSGGAPGEEDFTFGTYRPTVGSAPEGHQSRRQSVRFSMEDVSSRSPERRPKPSTPTSTPTPTRPGRPTSDWLGLKQDAEDEEDEEERQKYDAKEPAGVPESRRPPPPPSRGGGKSLSRAVATPEPAEELRGRASSTKATGTLPSRKEEEEEEDWLTRALSKSKGQGARRLDEGPEQQHGLGEETDQASLHSKRNATVTPRERQEDKSAPWRPASTESLVGSGRQQSPIPTPATAAGALHSPTTPATPTDLRLGAGTTAPVQQVALSSSQPPMTLSADSLQQLLLQQQLAHAQLWGLGASLDLNSVQRRDTHQQPVDITTLQARIIQLQGQVRSLQMEKDQIQMLLDSVQQRHTQDTELMENAHRARVKLLEDSASQREARAHLESQDLAERLAAATRLAEQERAELQEQHQRRLAQCQHDRDREVERLRELQRKSILEIKDDYEEQLQRLRKLKDEEIDAVTSATSQTRSLTAVIEQVEQFSRRLGDLASRVENTHESAAQGLELGARHRDQQLRVLQERLSQQQREMAEERARLKEVIAKMDTQLAEQQRTLQQERWRVAAEQAKADAALRGLDEERRSMTQHIAMEREELERAKSALLEEQQAVMQQCAVERRKLAAEWTQFHTQEKIRQERMEREASHAMERDAHREGSIFSMAQEQAELTLRAGQQKQKEEALQKDRENLDTLREALEKEKVRLSAAALRLQTRTQEVESFSKLAADRYEEGERALQEARKVETEHQARLRTIHAEVEHLRKQEHSLQQERMRITDHHKEVVRMGQNLPINPISLSSAPLFTAIGSTRLDAPVTVPVTNTSSPELQATLALLRHTAEKDRDFLQDEQFFLETLKKAPYNSAFHTA